MKYDGVHEKNALMCYHVSGISAVGYTNVILHLKKSLNI